MQLNKASLFESVSEMVSLDCSSVIDTRNITAHSSSLRESLLNLKTLLPTYEDDFRLFQEQVLQDVKLIVGTLLKNVQQKNMAIYRLEGELEKSQTVTNAMKNEVNQLKEMINEFIQSHSSEIEKKDRQIHSLEKEILIQRQTSQKTKMQLPIPCSLEKKQYSKSDGLNNITNIRAVPSSPMIAEESDEESSESQVTKKSEKRANSRLCLHLNELSDMSNSIFGDENCLSKSELKYEEEAKDREYGAYAKDQEDSCLYSEIIHLRYLERQQVDQNERMFESGESSAILIEQSMGCSRSTQKRMSLEIIQQQASDMNSLTDYLHSQRPSQNNCSLTSDYFESQRQSRNQVFQSGISERVQSSPCKDFLNEVQDSYEYAENVTDRLKREISENKNKMNSQNSSIVDGEFCNSSQQLNREGQDKSRLEQEPCSTFIESHQDSKRDSQAQALKEQTKEEHFRESFEKNQLADDWNKRLKGQSEQMAVNEESLKSESGIKEAQKPAAFTNLSKDFISLKIQANKSKRNISNKENINVYAFKKSSSGLLGKKILTRKRSNIHESDLSLNPVSKQQSEQPSQDSLKRGQVVRSPQKKKQGQSHQTHSRAVSSIEPFNIKKALCESLSHSQSYCKNVQISKVNESSATKSHHSYHQSAGRSQSAPKPHHQRSNSSVSSSSNPRRTKSKSKEKLKVTSKNMSVSPFSISKPSKSTKLFEECGGFSKNKGSVYFGGTVHPKNFLQKLKLELEQYQIVLPKNKVYPSDSTVVPDGYAKQIYENGTIFEGTLKDGKFDGDGQLILNDFSIFEGSFIEGKIQGQSYVKSLKLMTENCPKGLQTASYFGTIRDNKFEGMGTIFLNQKQKIVTKFHQSVPHGELTYYSDNGVQFGCWPTSH